VSATLAAVEAENRRWVGWLEGPNNDQSSGGDWGRRQGVGNYYAYCNSAADMIAHDVGYRHYPESTFGERGCAYTPTTKNLAVAHGDFIWDHASRGAPAGLALGDRPLYSWNGNDVPDHIGSFIVAIYADESFDCIELNAGSPQGCHVIRRNRKYLIGVHRLRHFDGAVAAPTSPPPVHEARPVPAAGLLPLDVDGEVGPPQIGQPSGIYLSCRALQHAVGTDDDGMWGPDTCKATQRRVGTDDDGDWGRQSTKALQHRVGAAVDGGFGPDTARALQRCLNASRF
jgi:hypothetical protein